jgi:hypothetical protein
MAGQEDVKTSAVALVGFLGAVFLVALIILLQVVYYWAADRQVQRKEVEPPAIDLRAALAAQQAKLTEYRWMDQKHGIAAIPIARAMDLVVRDLAAGEEEHAKPK